MPAKAYSIPFSRIRRRWTATALLLALATGSASAQSPSACSDLDQARIPALEGRDTMFFRIDPDLAMETRFPDGLIEDFSSLSQALATRGTTLVLVPVPTKGIVHADKLGPDAKKYGFDPRVARALYADTLATMRSKGLIAVDAVAALDDPRAQEPAFFGTDPRLTSSGLRSLARSVAEEIGEERHGQERFESVSLEPLVLPSTERFFLQLNCQAELPEPRTLEFTTEPDPFSDTGGVIVVGTGITGGDERNFPGFLAEATGRRLQREILADDATAAMNIYLTSDDFQQEAPEILVWLLPIWTNPALHGDRRMQELIAAAKSDCDGTLTVERSGDGVWYAALEDVEHAVHLSLRLEARDHLLGNARFSFTNEDGLRRVRSVDRSDETRTHRIYLPLADLWPEGAAEVRIEAEPALDSPPTLSICRG